MKEIIAIIINGRHGGTLFVTKYNPIIKIPIEDKSQISIGEEYDNSVRVGDNIEYKECFRSVDKKCVMYSTSGYWEDIQYAVMEKLEQTYPINLINQLRKG